MKRKLLISMVALLTLMGILFLAPSALAQDEPPGANGDMLNSPENGMLTPGPAAEKAPGFKDRAAPGASRDVTPETGILDIAVTDYFESDSDVAFGNSVYGIAYELNGHIYVAFFNNSGHFISRYQITEGPANHSHPAIAYEGTSNLFVVAYEYDFGGGNVDIYSRAVSPFSGTKGDEKNLTFVSNDSEADPDLDCNHDDTSCLVVFSHSGTNKHIQGRFVDVSSTTGLSPIGGDPFRVSSSDNKEGPYVAWGWNNDRYMVVYHQPLSGGIDHSYFTHVYETYQSPGPQYMFNSTYLYLSTSVVNDTIATGITYDPVTERFLTLVRHDYMGTGDYDVHLFVNKADSQLGYIGPLIIADTGYGDETQGSISFLTTPWEGQTDTGPDNVSIAYSRSDSNKTEIMTTVITGNGSKTSPSYDIPYFIEHVEVKSVSALMSYVESPAVAGSDGSGLYMVTWTYHMAGTVHDEDIKGMILRESGSNVYLPLIIR